MSNKDFVAFGFEVTFFTNHLKNENSWSKAVETRKIFNPLKKNSKLFSGSNLCIH